MSSVMISNGIDLVDIKRFESAVKKWDKKFFERIFTQKEIDYSQKKHNCAQHLAARFAVKEAFFKAVANNDIRIIRWKEIEVLNDETGKPRICLHGEYKKIVTNTNISLSISHSGDYAIASVIICK